MLKCKFHMIYFICQFINAYLFHRPALHIALIGSNNSTTHHQNDSRLQHSELADLEPERL